MGLVKPINDKVSMFATNDEMYDQLTTKEISLIKLVKLEEFADDLYRSTQSNYHAELFPADKSWFKIKELLRELRKLNK
tara:strand:+ start:1135 stop:1371 length:237 start_codon:yes stop_codon:yes gene_type:complete